MKKSINLVGFTAALLFFATIVMKINHFPGAGEAMAITGFVLSIYLPFFLLYRSGNGMGSAAIVGSVSASLINLGITFKFQHWPGAGVMLVLGLTSFALIFVPLLLRHRLKEGASDRKAFMNTCGAMGLTLFSLGLLFKIMHWPGAAIMLTLSVGFLFIGYFLLYLLDKSIDQEIKTIYLRKAFFTVIMGGMIATLIMLNLQRPWHQNQEANPPVAVACK